MKEKKNYNCKVCNIIILNDKAIIKHYRILHEHKCKYCDYITYDKETLNTHFNDLHFNEWFKHLMKQSMKKS